MRDLYQARLLDHARNPRNKGELKHATVVERAANPSCGDSLTLYLVLNGDRIMDVAFTGDGCAVSQAAASLLTDRVRGMLVASAAALTERDMYDLIGVDVRGGRTRCALLAFNALHSALRTTGGT